MLFLSKMSTQKKKTGEKSGQKFGPHNKASGDASRREILRELSSQMHIQAEKMAILRKDSKTFPDRCVVFCIWVHAFVSRS